MFDWLSRLSEDPFYEFSIILGLAALLGMLGKVLKQPLIVMFIALGVLVGPAVFDVVQSKENIHLLAEIGIAVLLFIVGLKLDLRIIKSVGKIALLTGLGQVIFTSLFGYFIALALDFSSLHSFYIAVALTFSSTIIIVKLLSDKKEIDSLHGQIAIGFLIVQDIVVILVMIILSAIGNNSEGPIYIEVFKTLIAGGVLLGFSLAAMRWLLPALTDFLAKSQELLTLFAIAWALLLASIGELMGFSGEVGAFLAGVSLASSKYKELVSSRLVSLRDFLLLFFFVNLGSELDFSVIGSQLIPAIILSLFVLIGNPIIVLIIMGRIGYTKRTSFLAGLTVAQISEFSLIFAGLGLAVGHITDEILGLITLVGLITIGLSTYLILYSHQIYKRLAPMLSMFERKNPDKDHAFDHVKTKYDLILFGVGRFGTKIAKSLDEHADVDYLAVDFDPEVVKSWRKKGKDIVYGDIEDPDLLEQVPFSSAKFIISTISNVDQSRFLVKALKEQQFDGKIFLTAMKDRDFEALSKCGAYEVLKPFEMASENFYNANIKMIVNQ